MKTNIFASIVFFGAWILMGSSNNSPSTKHVQAAATATVEVIQFHSEHRCYTCNKIEEFTRKTLSSYKQVPFKLVNADDKKNEKIAKDFQAFGSALFLFNPKTGAKKDLTDFAFMNANNEEKFIAGLKKELDAFIKL